MRKLTHEEIVSRQVKRAGVPRLPLCVALNNIRSLHNVGTIFGRGWRGCRKNLAVRYYRLSAPRGIAKTALGAEDHVPWEYREDILGLIKELKNEGYQIVLLEQMQGSTSHDVFKARSPVCLVVGNEVEGIAEGLQSLSDAAIEIEMNGIKNSLNVGVAFGIVVYQLRAGLIGRCP